MCGIFGLITSNNLPVEKIVTTACTRMTHRGPDGHGVFHRDTVTLGHRRLSIIDLSLGAQPMHSNDGRYSITYNGEIYNHLSLRQELQEMGYTFATESDTETLLYAFAAWGEQCLNRLYGMFAFAIADYATKEVFIARDHFGIKPLFYRTGSDFFAFSSELPPLSQMDGFATPEVEPAAVTQFFRYQYISSPLTIYKSIFKLPPAHFMRLNFKGEVLKTKCYKNFHFAAENKDHNSALEQTEALVRDAVIANTLSDVPVGVYLSGGIDSTLVAMNLAQSVSQDIPAFTIAFKEQEYSELEYAQVAAKKLGLKLNVSYVESMALDKLPEILSYYGEPYGDSSVLPTWHVAELARQHVTVVLSGDGGDELFGGYHSHASWLASLKQNHLKQAIRAAMTLHPRAALHHLRLVGKKDNKTVEFWHNFIQYHTPNDISKILNPPYQEHAFNMAPGFTAVAGYEKEFGDLDLVQHLDLKTYMPECILPKVDVTSMQHSLEVRPALLHPEILDFALRLPQHQRYQKGKGGKVLLKEVLLRNGFDSDFVYRKKQGFGIPINHWFLKNGHARTLLEDLLNTHQIELAEYLNINNVRKLINSHSLSHNVGGKLWLILAFACWIHNTQG